MSESSWTRSNSVVGVVSMYSSSMVRSTLLQGWKWVALMGESGGVTSIVADKSRFVDLMTSYQIVRSTDPASKQTNVKTRKTRANHVYIYIYIYIYRLFWFKHFLGCFEMCPCMFWAFPWLVWSSSSRSVKISMVVQSVFWGVSLFHVTHASVLQQKHGPY